ncbi:PREDICTED: ribosome biogenesis protein BRX1 homolog [Dufourea novaeangliae]|uniref:Ribosome biogenesis protein BRX1 homolog n=1 Tax=Dufourea novaeangliae TaxID=178035 RepID=A0A154PEL4_DUFNO|nr:PREDICTED: ribosome biogenesis protein BRX1 homolog [Dufourea novaeangliae]KZC10293.1 Ribosome biogenesis protein BRX1 like protein [Dufourea novaeangliae]
MTKKNLKRKRTECADKANVPEIETLPPKRMSDEPSPKKVKWINKQRVLVFATRGISYRHRHLMDDIKTLMPHHRPESKMERTTNLQVVNEMCQMKNCNKTILFEGRRKRDLYLWFSNVSDGPSAKFLIENIYTMGELKMTGNCLKGSRPLLSFDENFNTKPHYSLLKELLIQIFGVPNHHPKSQPFFDHVYTFSVLDNRIWFRNFQILTEDGGLAEIGPRFVLNPIKIFGGSFGGEVLWENPTYISPTKFRQSINKKAAGKYVNKVEQKIAQEVNKPKESYSLNPMDEIFKGDPLEKAKEIEEKEVKMIETNKNDKNKVKKRVKKQLGKKIQKISIKKKIKN